MTRTLAATYADRLTETLPAVREQIARAAEASGRTADTVRLVAVTKSHPVEAVVASLEAGLTDLGENRVEELETKVSHFGSDSVTWHMIGHIQSRKAVRAAAVSGLVHSVDSLKLARKLSDAAAEGGRELQVLAQVNTAGEEQKYGLDPEHAFDEILTMAELAGLRINGLMTMAPFVDDEVVLGTAFARLRTLSERLVAASDRIGRELSMGMTNDLHIAIREGSTMVRIGTALFGPRTGFTQ